MEWPKITLCDLTPTLESGSRPKGGSVNKGIPSLGAEHLDESGGFKFLNIKYIPEDHYNRMTSGIIKKDDILIVKDGATTGKVSLVKNDFPFEDAAINEHVFLLRLDPQKCYSRFCFYYLTSSQGQKELMSDFRGATVGGISRNILNKICIPLPPLNIQKQIADTLDKVDRLYRIDRELIQKYDALAQGIFCNMFGDPVKNENGWEVKKLKEISTKIHSGNTPKGGSNVYVEKGITFFRSQNVWKNRLEFDDIAFIDDRTHRTMNKSSLKHRDILMTKTGRINTENSSLGRAALFLGKDDSANINGHVYLIRLQKNQINEFVLHILTTKEYRNLIREVCVGGIDKRQLNKEHIEDFPIIFPPIDLQKQFVDMLLVIQKQKLNAEITVKKTKDIFEHLIQKAFRGNLLN